MSIRGYTFTAVWEWLQGVIQFNQQTYVNKGLYILTKTAFGYKGLLNSKMAAISRRGCQVRLL